MVLVSDGIGESPKAAGGFANFVKGNVTLNGPHLRAKSGQVNSTSKGGRGTLIKLLNCMNAEWFRCK